MIRNTVSVMHRRLSTLSIMLSILMPCVLCAWESDSEPAKRAKPSSHVTWVNYDRRHLASTPTSTSDGRSAPSQLRILEHQSRDHPPGA